MGKRIVLVAGVIALGAVACGEVKNAVVQGVQTGAVEAVGQSEIERVAGVKFKGDLDCKMNDITPGQSTPVDCGGTTADGKPVTLKGHATEVEVGDKKNFAKGDFTAMVDGKQIFSKSCLGTC